MLFWLAGFSAPRAPDRHSRRWIRRARGSTLWLMERARATWTDERLDDLGRRVESGFERLDQDLRAVNGRIDALQRTMIQIGAVTGGGIFATLVSVIATRG
jgi:hypothetical protein